MCRRSADIEHSARNLTIDNGYLAHEAVVTLERTTTSGKLRILGKSGQEYMSWEYVGRIHSSAWAAWQQLLMMDFVHKSVRVMAGRAMLVVDIDSMSEHMIEAAHHGLTGTCLAVRNI